MPRWKPALHCVAVLLLLLPSGTWLNASGLDSAEWIGSTRDDRDERWAVREVHFARAPQSIPGRSHLSPLLRTGFSVEKAVLSAEVSVTGLGLWELWINGSRVGDQVLEPAQTAYESRVFFRVLDVTDHLVPGPNALGVMLGNGFFGQSVAFRADLNYGIPRAKLSLTLRYADGSTSTLNTDGRWRASPGPVVFDNVFFGETFDARRLPDNWSKPGFDDASWSPAEILPDPGGTLVEQQMPPMRRTRRIDPIAVLPADEGWILDMGENMTGWLEIRVREAAGTAIEMRFAEHLMPDRRSIDTASTGVHVTGGEQKDIYLCRGGGEESWEPRFTYHGFRYVQITGLSSKPDPADFHGWFVRTDAERIGSFETSDALINSFYEVSMRTIEGNLQGLLTDCPHRERCAWMGDMHAVAEAASYNYDLRAFWRKSVRDMESTLGKTNGGPGLPRDPRAPAAVAVGKRLIGQARPDWGMAAVLVPWQSYLHYGDLELVKESWPLMSGWLEFLAEFHVKDGTIEAGYGDWCPPGSNSQIDTPTALTSTMLYHRALVAMHHMALALDKPAEAKAYQERAAATGKAFNDRFFSASQTPGPNAPPFGYGSQTGNAVALASGLVPAGQEQAVADALAAEIMEKAGGHYSTGIFGHRPLYTQLNDFGHADVTRHLWRTTDWPSLGFMTVKHGLTTWPEVPLDWEPDRRYRRNSFNHPMHSGFAAAFHESLGGIRPDPARPGFEHIVLRPCFLPDLEWATATLRSPRGLISSGWKRENGGIVWNVTIPPGATATAYPGGSREPQALSPGTHRLVIEPDPAAGEAP